MSRFVAPPSALLMQIANDPRIEAFVNSLTHVRLSAEHYCKMAGEDFYSFDNILDFGCGVGRFLFAFDEHLGPSQKLYGCDLNKDCAKWCEDNISFAEVTNSSANPPLPYADNSIDYINAVSVFTHLSFDMQMKWAWEIHRILRPGGIIAFTTNGLGAVPFLLGLTKNVFPIQEYCTVGDNGLFGALHEEENKDNEGQRAIATFNSLETLKSVFYPLELRYYEPLSALAGGQAIAVFKKTRAGKILRPSVDSGNPDQLRFPAQYRASEFRCFLSFESDAYFIQDQPVDFAFSASSGNVRVESKPIGIKRIYANTHFIPFGFSVPPQLEDFNVALAPKPGSNLPQMRVHWPHMLAWSASAGSALM